MPSYDDLVVEISACNGMNFVDATRRLITYIDSLSRADISGILLDIGAIPQSVVPSSSEEKLYSKATDIVLARCFTELGLQGEVLESRGDSADVAATSVFHGYSLVADSKAMRLSRTAKNQKDFKVGALGDNWIGDDNTFAVLCCPLYQYPTKSSQIYEQALNNKTCFFSWEYMKYLIDNNIRETDDFSLEPIWAYITRLSRMAGINRKANFFDKIDENICRRINHNVNDMRERISTYYEYIVRRAIREREDILNSRIAEINNLTREEAIQLLIEKEEKKTETLDKLIERLQGEDEE